ncbi:MAG TPA: cysteine dioxygenase family protein [Nakamurella sp.]
MTSTETRETAADIAGRLDGPTVAARRARRIAERAGPITLDTLPGRDLDPDELVELASSVAGDPAPLEPHIAFSDERRHYVSLHRDTHVDVWLLCWTPRNDTGWHDHDISSGAIAVLRGALTEHNLAVADDSIRTDVAAGEVFGFGPDHIHRLTAGIRAACPCTPTLRHCGGWVSTRSDRAGCCGGAPCPTPTNCAPPTNNPLSRLNVSD